VVHRDVEEALDLPGVQVQGEDPVGARGPAEARRSASIMISSSIRCSLTGGQVGWMTKVSSPRAFSSKRT